MANVFICHRGADALLAERLANDVRSAGHKVWLDSMELNVGDHIVHRMNTGLAGATYLILCYSSAGMSPWMDVEWMSALTRQLNGEGIKVLPVALSGKVAPATLIGTKYADLITDWNRGLDDLLKAIKIDRADLPVLVIILHSSGDEEHAELLAAAIEDFGYKVWHRELTHVGDIEFRELTDRMALGGPIVVCGTARAAGSKWLSQLVANVRGPSAPPRLFPVRLELDANLEALSLGVKIVECFPDFQAGIAELRKGLTKHFPLPAARHTEEDNGNDYPPQDFDSWLTKFSSFSSELLRDYRGRLRPEIRESKLIDELDARSFLEEANLLIAGKLFASGVLLFTEKPEKLVPTAYVQCVQYSGLDQSSAQDGRDFYGPVVAQLEGAMTFIKSRVEKVEVREVASVAARVEYQFPMVCLSEILANALCHRDYLDRKRHTHVRLFQDRIEVESPGLWEARRIVEDKVIGIAELRSPPASRNERLASALRWIRLAETEGSGIPNALKDCEEQGADLPDVTSHHGVIRVTVYPRRDWNRTAFGRRGATTDVRQSETPQPKAEPIDELVLELTDLGFHEQDGVRRASARARLIYEPATPGQSEVVSARSWRLFAPLGPIEAEELRWYLEKYAIWPSHYFRDRARKVEEHLVEWGRLLYRAAMPVDYTANVMNAWSRIGDHTGRRFSVYVDPYLQAGAPDTDVKTAKEAATLLLALPWELLHDGDSYLFQGAKPVRVRRRLPNTETFEVSVVATPIRILLITARPEDESCSYIDHRASALPLVEAMESLPGLVKIHILSPPTLTALRDELDRARDEGKPYHVIHFDGHGVYDRSVGLGALCFEHTEDVDKLDRRRHITVFTNELGPLLRDHGIALVFLEACQTAQAEKVSESVASELLRVGVSSVVAMSHSVLVETARRFVEAFYQALADGKRVGDAMLEGQRWLHADTFRGQFPGAGELRLEDWFVPVLFQQRDDLQLFRTAPAKQTHEDFQAALSALLGDLPSVPETGFIGRSRDLLALQRLLRKERYAVIRGQGGEGKTALAAEFARWMVRSQQMRRAAFVSVETHGNERAVLDALGKQLAQKDFSAAGDLEHAIQHVERALREQSALLVIDNMESVLLPPFMEKETPEALSEEAREEVKAILALCERLLKTGDTRVVFTSREVLPAPFDAVRNRRELHQLEREDAVRLVQRVLIAAGASTSASSDAAREQIEQLADAVHCHARTLALLAPSLRDYGVEATRESLVELMAEMEKRFPGSRERSVFASVELSLQRLSEKNQERARVLAVFYGGVQLGMLRLMMQWEEADLASLARELIETGLATNNPYNHLTLNPALCPYLRGRMNEAEREDLTVRWIEAMHTYVGFLNQQEHQNAEVTSTLTVLDLPNLFALLDLVQRTGNAEATIDLATSFHSLLRNAGKPRLLERVGHVRHAAAASLGDTWNDARFQAVRTSIEQQLAEGLLREALNGAQQLLQHARAAGEQAYPSAGYDLAVACFLLARVLQRAGGSEQAVRLLDEARERFEAIAGASGNNAAEGMASACITEIGDCLRDLGRLDEAAAAYEEGIHRSEQRGEVRQVAVGKAQLGTIRMLQGRYPEAREAHAAAREQFMRLDEPGSVAVTWHQTGIGYQEAGDPEAAEDAYRKSLAITVQLGDIAGQARTLVQLGNLYAALLDRPEESVIFYRQAADKYVESRDVASEGNTRNNLAVTLRSLRRLDEARQELQRAIECKAHFGHASEPWKSWAVLSDIEEDTGNTAAAVEAKRKAITSYLSYRRDGGENHNMEGRISLAVTESLLAGNDAAAASLLQQLATDPDLPSNATTFIRALQAIINGSRDHALADTPDLNYSMAAEILLLIETLEKRS